MGITEEMIREQLKNVYDPELNINVVDLGLIYSINVNKAGAANVTMTLTTPGCPLHDSIVSGVKYCILEITGITSAEVELVWEPAWTPEMMTPEGMRLLRG
ncbi:metal-sulfur cluster assembly factor [Neobacillus sp. PS3-34]|uniref:metal-sulfur cluster assembly factor n=1 Tax=Neobacillus sp. PS3-34 TaxID=3070678 RepID=UPI0027DF2DFC|nr:metal-sulfur cluster assembly factor [Neobacillus sp. PS3-34]WML47741.1 metal-sulfur cluster assembly factor [Neobacillus sp. PS3-34]